jgi:hypothetical protein
VSLDRPNIEPAPNTVAWIVTQRDLLRRALREEKFNRELAGALFPKIERSGTWRLLSDMNGRPFASFEAFCRSPNGMALDRKEIERRIGGLTPLDELLRAWERANEPERMGFLAGIATEERAAFIAQMCTS